MKKPELLAPAGNFEKLKTAIHYGADAVYMGLSDFSLRAKADNFDAEGLKSAVAYARRHDVKSYITANIFPHNRDIPLLRDHVDFVGDIRPDGVIISDIGVFEMFNKHAPHVPIHISTQANITNHESAQFWERLGARRLVLSRELAIEEIAGIREKVDTELECFVHGAVCLSYSGRCYISAFLAGRSANRGECTNSCRWNYTLMEEKRRGEYFPVYENDRGAYMLSSRDLCMIEYLDKLYCADVKSFKIEGRMKGVNYVAGVVKTYREAVDALLADDTYTVKERWLAELNMFSSRGYTTGMYLGRQKKGDYNHGDKDVYRMSHTFVGIASEIRSNSAKVLMRSRLFPGDKVEFLTPGLEGMVYEIESIEDENGVATDSARNDEIVYISVPEGVRAGDIIRKQVPFP